MFRRSAPVRVAGGALAVVLAAMLTGCFANPLESIMDSASEEAAKSAAEELVKKATGDEVDFEIGSLPDDFPSQITLVSDDNLQSITVPQGTMVTVTDSRSMTELIAQVKEDFSDWEEVAWTEMGDAMSGGTYEKGDTLRVNVALMHAPESEAVQVTYTLLTPGQE